MLGLGGPGGTAADDRRFTGETGYCDSARALRRGARPATAMPSRLRTGLQTLDEMAIHGPSLSGNLSEASLCARSTWVPLQDLAGVRPYLRTCVLDVDCRPNATPTVRRVSIFTGQYTVIGRPVRARAG